MATDKKTFGITKANANTLAQLVAAGRFGSELDAAKFALAYAIKSGVQNGSAEGAETKWNVGSVDPDGSMRRCCTNRHGPARCPPTGSSPVEAIRHGSAEGGHPIEDRTAENDLTPLPGWPPGPEALSENGRVSEARVLHPALTMGP